MEINNFINYFPFKLTKSLFCIYFFERLTQKTNVIFISIYNLKNYNLCLVIALSLHESVYEAASARKG